jgi:tetratricopeptide (TPR) repeat protein
MGAISYLSGDFQDARKQYEKAIPILEKYSNKYYLRYAWSNMGELSLSEKKFNDAIIMFEKVKNISVFNFDHKYTSCAFIGISEAYLGLGDSEIAEHCVLEAMDLVEQFEITVEMGMAERVLGDIQSQTDRKTEAVGSYKAAIEILEKLNELEEVEKAREGLKKITAGSVL